MNVGTILRTAQSYFPAFKPAKDALYRQARRLFRVPHEQDFRVLDRLWRDQNEVLVDVGANHGQTIESMRLFQPQAPIFAFEANAALATLLQTRYASWHAVRVESCGLGETAGVFTLHVPSYRGFLYDGLASLDRAQAEGWLGPATIYGFDRGKLTIANHACRVATLDSFDLTPAFLKIDVQGLEYDVLVGAKRTIETNRPAVLVEAFDSDPRIGVFMASLGYGVFHVAQGSVCMGLGPGPNTLLLHPDRPRFPAAAI